MFDPERLDAAPDDTPPSVLTDQVLEIGRRIAAQRDFPAAAKALVDAAVAVVPGVRWASVTRGLDTRFETAASSDPVAEGADMIQYLRGTGPCIDAVINESVFESADLAIDSRWSGFGPHAASVHGTRSVLSIRLSLEGDTQPNASLNLYGDHIDAFDIAARRQAVLLAGCASIAVTAVIHRQDADQMRVALASNREIGTAMGVLMATLKVSREQAFALLRGASQSSNRKLRVIAAEVADTGLLEPSPGLRRP